MANQVTNRTVNIYIESGQAQKAFDALIKKETQLKEELAAATNPKVVERLNKDLAALTEPLDRAAKKASGDLSPSLRDVQTTVNNLGNRLKRLSAEDADFEPVLAQWRQGRRELEAQTEKVGLLQRAMNSFWKEAKTVAVGVIIGNTVESMLSTVMGYVTGMVTGSAKIADELADIEKTTGLNADQVQRLNSELSKIDTRTSSSDLRKLASEAGKLGAGSVEDVKKFVDQADKIKVALGEDLGDDAIVSIGKLSKIFKTEMLNIGSAINEIGAKSEASESFAVDFLNRLAGTGPAVKLSAGDLLGYGAALEVAGQTAEVSGTALSTFFIEFVRDSEKFGKAAGFAKGELSTLINQKGTNAGFIEFLTRLKEANPDTSGFLAKMQQLGIDGSRGANVMLALSNNIQAVKDQQLIANDAIGSNASIMNEFSKKNNNAAAELDKLKKNFASLFASDTIRDGGAAAVRVLNGFVNLLKSIPQFVSENRTALIALTAVVVTYTVAKTRATQASILNRAASLVEAAQDRTLALVKGVVAAATTAYAFAKDVLTGKIKLATIVQRVWNAVLLANPIGLVVGALGAAATAISLFTEKTETDTVAQQNHNDVLADVRNQTAATKDEIETLTKVITSSTATTEEKSKALDKLKSISSDYLSGLTLENIATKEGIAIIQEYIKYIDALADAKARVNLKTKLKEQLLEKDNELSGLETEKAGKAEISGSRKFFTGADGKFFGIGDRNRYDVEQDQKKAKEERDQLQRRYDAMANGNDAQIESLRKSTAGQVEKLKTLKKGSEEAKALARSISANNQQIAIYTGVSLAAPSATDGKVVGGGGTSDKKPSAGKKENTAKKQKEEFARFQERMNDMALSLLPDDSLTQKFDKQLKQLDDKYEKERSDLRSNEVLSNAQKNQLLIALEQNFVAEKAQLFKDQALEAKKQIDKEIVDSAKVRDFRKRFLQDIQKDTAKLEGNGLRINELLGRDRAAKAELDAAKRSAKETYQFKVQTLRNEREAILRNTEYTENEKKNIIRRIDEAIADERERYLIERFSKAVEFAKGAVDLKNLFGSVATNRENAELARDKATNDKKKANLEKRLKSGTISQQAYDRELKKIQEDQDKREKEIRTKQFKREQKAAIANVLISAAEGAIKLWAKPGFPANIPLLALLGLQTGLQVAAIASKKPEFGRGGMLNGPRHSDKSKGMPVSHPYTGEVQAYMEGGEGIGSRRTMQDRRQYNVSGTPSQIYSLLNGLNGGVTWSSGATLRPAWKNPVPMAFSTIGSSLATVRRYESGGQFGTATSPGGTGKPDAGLNGEAMLAMLQQLMATNQALDATLANLQVNGVKADVSLGKIRDAEKREKAVLDASTLR